MTKLYAWASCPCGWQLFYAGAPVGWKPDPAEVNERYLQHLLDVQHMKAFA